MYSNEAVVFYSSDIQGSKYFRTLKFLPLSSAKHEIVHRKYYVAYGFWGPNQGTLDLFVIFYFFIFFETNHNQYKKQWRNKFQITTADW